MNRSHLSALLLGSFTAIGCGPAPDPGPQCVTAGEPEISIGLDADEFSALTEESAVVVDEDESGQLVVDLRVRVDGMSAADPVTSLSVFLYADPGEPVGDPQLGDEGQGCINEGAARECNSIDLRCVGQPGVDEACLHLLGNSALATPAFSCDEDDALHQRALTVRLLQNTPVEELEGIGAELRFFLETSPDQFIETVIPTTIDVVGVP